MWCSRAAESGDGGGSGAVDRDGVSGCGAVDRDGVSGCGAVELPSLATVVDRPDQTDQRQVAAVDAVTTVASVSRPASEWCKGWSSLGCRRRAAVAPTPTAIQPAAPHAVSTSREGRPETGGSGGCSGDSGVGEQSCVRVVQRLEQSWPPSTGSSGTDTHTDTTGGSSCSVDEPRRQTRDRWQWWMQWRQWRR